MSSNRFNSKLDGRCTVRITNSRTMDQLDVIQVSTGDTQSKVLEKLIEEGIQVVWHKYENVKVPKLEPKSKLSKDELEAINEFKEKMQEVLNSQLNKILNVEHEVKNIRQLTNSIYHMNLFSICGEKVTPEIVEGGGLDFSPQRFNNKKKHE